jgi:hypothetical protein
VGLALFPARLQQAGRTWAHRTGAAALLAAVCLLEQGLQTASFEVAPARADVTWLAARVPQACRSFFYAPPRGAFPSWKYQLDAVWAALERGVPTVNGYSGKAPPGWQLEEVLPTEAAGEARARAGLRAWMQARGLSEQDVCRIEEVARR